MSELPEIVKTVTYHYNGRVYRSFEEAARVREDDMFLSFVEKHAPISLRSLDETEKLKLKQFIMNNLEYFKSISCKEPKE